MDGSTKSLKIDDINSCQRMRGEQSCACAKLLGLFGVWKIKWSYSFYLLLNSIEDSIMFELRT